MDTIHNKATVAKALSHPCRVLIMELLSEGHLTYTQMIDKVPVVKSTLFKHLTILYRSKLITTYSDNGFLFYRISEDIEKRLEGFRDFMVEIKKEHYII